MNVNLCGKRAALRYSISMLLFLIACVCGYLGGYRSGYQAGDNAFQYHSTYSRTYNVMDLVELVPNPGGPAPSRADFTAVLAVIQHAGIGEPEDSFQATMFPTNLSVVVTANGDVHRRIHTALEDFHKNATPPALIDANYKKFNEKLFSVTFGDNS